jgi:O-Antigen ligase
VLLAFWGQLRRSGPMGAVYLLLGYTLFFAGATSDATLTWLGTGALVVLTVTLAVDGIPARACALLPLAAFAAWCAMSIAWSTLPDRSWEYANRAFVYLLFAALGLCLAPRTRAVTLCFSALLGLVGVWALAGKVFPGLSNSYSTARLSAPVGLWNQLALLGDFALPIALWLAGRLRIAGTLLAYVWMVALALTLSRGGIALAVIAVVAWLALSDEGGVGVATLLSAGLPAAAVVASAFELAGVTQSGQSDASRWHDGLIFGALLLAGAVASGVLSSVPRPRLSPVLRRAGTIGTASLAATLVIIGALKSRSAWDQFTSSRAVSNSSNRLLTTDSNFRWVWWNHAWHAFTLHPLIGTGAGSFQLTDLLYRASNLDDTIEPHDLPLQFFSETGLVGGLLGMLAFGTLIWLGRRRRGPELALALLLPTYLLHSLIDIDWDFAAVSGPAFLAAGAVAGRALPKRRISVFGVLLLGGAAIGLFVCLLLPWLGNRWENEAQADTTPAKALKAARRAHAVDPLLIGPLLTQAEWQPSDTAGKTAALALYLEMTRMQPKNPYTWLFLGEFELSPDTLGCPRLAYSALERFTNLDDHDVRSLGAADKDRALAFVNSGRPDPATCDAYEDRKPD